MSGCIQNYSVPLAKLEKLTGGSSSGTKIKWTDDLIEDFENAKLKIKTLEQVYTPTPVSYTHLTLPTILLV